MKTTSTKESEVKNTDKSHYKLRSKQVKKHYRDNEPAYIQPPKKLRKKNCIAKTSTAEKEQTDKKSKSKMSKKEEESRASAKQIQNKKKNEIKNVQKE